MGNLFLEFEILLKFHVIYIFYNFFAYQETRPHKIWWKESKQFTHWDLIERVVWDTDLKMRDRKNLFSYYMTYKTFIYLARKLEPFIKFKVTMFDRAPLEL